MNIKRLQAFALVAELGSFSEAADKLGMTQSGISRQIQSLEEELQLTLLQRGSLHTELTPAGQAVYERGKRLLKEWALLLDESGQASLGTRGRLRIGASSVPGMTLLPALILSLKQQSEQLHITVHTGSSRQVLARLERRELDAALVGSAPISEGFTAVPVASDVLLVIGTEAHTPIADLRELGSLPLILREPGSGTREALYRSLLQSGVDPEQLNVIGETNGPESALALVGARLGVTVLSKWSLPFQLPSPYRILGEFQTDRQFYAVFPDSIRNDPLIERFVNEALGLDSFFTEHARP